MAIGIIYATHVHWLSASVHKHRILAICHSANVTSIGNNHPDSINLSHSCKRVVLEFMSSFHKGGTHTYMLHACCKSSLKSLINPKTRDKWAFSSLSFFSIFLFPPSSGTHARTFRLFCFLPRLLGALLAFRLVTAETSANDWPGLIHWIYLYEVRSIKSSKTWVFDSALGQIVRYHHFSFTMCPGTGSSDQMSRVNDVIRWGSDF